LPGRLSHLLALAAILLLPSLPAPCSDAADLTLDISYYHQIRMLGVPAVQQGTWRVSVHPPAAIRIDIEGSPRTVIYRFDGEGLTRIELDTRRRTYSRQPLAERRRVLAEQKELLGLPHDAHGPSYLVAGADYSSGWREQFRADGLLFLHYLLSGRIAAAAAVDESARIPASLLFALFQETPFSGHYWITDAVLELAGCGLPRCFEYCPEGPEYYRMNVSNRRVEKFPLPEELFLPPRDFAAESLEPAEPPQNGASAPPSDKENPDAP